ncbi:MAG: 4-diphosphocytidyl-2-C-methyl-D-erythritol kinase IspE [Phormidesmis priestleyi Ana]|uniref:4-diphosphocytidyl-2-C-methyl-D-erythritol kinase n=1 Tax=Phormidesmis priestleyi Ana TaxID=1666911 RepID=A0A0P7YWG7_9CYAN|nr:MAG: 4-diphosphocytidyl-2-C-methyl-D-erythritol kinase IspE [Phormidesmis priestleyi Ana]
MLTLLANAKINLYLEIIGNRPDGFHELVMIMQSVALADRITLTPLKSPTIQLLCDHPQVPTDHTNLAYRAVALLQKRFPEQTNGVGGVEIAIDKKIPVGAGLAGGSSNAAATLFGLNVLWNLGLTRAELQALGAELGSDVPFCLAGGCAIATGRGEEINPLPHSPQLYAVLAKYNSLSVSTPWAYKTYRQQFESTYLPLNDSANLAERQARVHSGAMVKALGSGDLSAIGDQLSNDLEKVVLPAYPKVNQLKQTMLSVSASQGASQSASQGASQSASQGASQGALGTMMSGSGPTVFTLTETLEQAQAIAHTVAAQVGDRNDLQLQVAPFTTKGIVLQP